MQIEVIEADKRQRLSFERFLSIVDHHVSER
jgi:hypothetical protein